MSAPEPSQSTNQGSFASEVELQRNNKHAPGIKVGNDAIPEFHAQTLPAGSAPASRTFKPNPDTSIQQTDDVPGTSQQQQAQSNSGEFVSASAADTMAGATSADVHTGMGKPIQGQTSGESENKRLGSKEGSVLANEKGTFDGPDRDMGRDSREGGEEGGERGEMVGAEERVPETAESLAAEFG